MARPAAAKFGVFIALGAGIGTAIGVAMNNIGVGVGVGIGIGIAMWALLNVRKASVQSEDKDTSDSG